MHKDSWNIKGVFSFSFSFWSCKVCCQGRAAVASVIGVRGSEVTWPTVLRDHLSGPVPSNAKSDKTRRRDNRENVWRMKVLWLSLFFFFFFGGGGWFSQYCWFFVAYLCVAFFCYKRRLKKEKKRTLLGEVCTVGGGRGDAPEPTAFLQYGTFCFDFCKPPPVFTCMSLSKKRVAQQNKTFTVSFPCPVR